MRIALSGSQGVGKSTLLRALDLPGHKKIKEVARQLIAELGKLPQNMSREEFFNFQMEIARRQLAKETGNFISDRAIYDTLAYAVGLPGYEKIENFVTAHASAYDYIFYLPIEFPLKLDGVRKNDETYRKLIDWRLRLLYRRFNIEFIEIGGSLKERVAKIKRMVKL